MKKLLMIGCVGLVAQVCFSAGMPTTIREVADASKKCSYRGTNGAELPYRLLSPDVKAGEKYPLVVFLHGAGERGDDNVLQLVHVDVLNLMYGKCADGTMRQHERKAFVIFPQCRKDSKWSLVSWGDKQHSALPAEPSEDMTNVHELVAKLKSDLPIDASRVYVTGISMGGYGTWDYITRWPEDVAAAIVVCGGADNSAVKARSAVNKIPIRIYHGSLDNAVPVERGRSAFAAVRDVNADATYIEYGKAGHGIWARTYREPGLGEWLFSRRQNQK